MGTTSALIVEGKREIPEISLISRESSHLPGAADRNTAVGASSRIWLPFRGLRIFLFITSGTCKAPDKAAHAGQRHPVWVRCGFGSKGPTVLYRPLYTGASGGTARRMQKVGAQTWRLLSRMNVDLILGGGFVLRSHLRLSCLYRAPTHERAPGELCEKISFLFIYKKVIY